GPAPGRPHRGHRSPEHGGAGAAAVPAGGVAVAGQRLGEHGGRPGARRTPPGRPEAAPRRAPGHPPGCPGARARGCPVIVRPIAQQEPPVTGVAYAACSCGWLVTRARETEARAAASTHALSHRVRHEAVSLPAAPTSSSSARRFAEGAERTGER